MLICVCETRSSNIEGLKWAVKSILASIPTARIQLFLSPAIADQLDDSWGPGVDISTDFDQDGGWNIKPSLLLRCLDNGEDRVVWHDADMITLNDWSPLVRKHSGDLIATEECFWGQQQGGDMRTQRWGLTPRRRLHATINTGFMVVGPQHTSVLEQWHSMLQDPEYRSAQRKNVHERPLHFLGDQEVFTALVGSTTEATLPIRLLKRGRDIAQCFGPGGYTSFERIKNFAAGSTPCLVHAMGDKPWHQPDTSSAASLRDRYMDLHKELSPYTLAVRSMARRSGEAAPNWTERRHISTAVLCKLTREHPALTELPLAIVDDVTRLARRTLKVGRYA